MDYQDYFGRMLELIADCWDYQDAEHHIAMQLERAGLMDYNEACDALMRDYDNQ